MAETQGKSGASRTYRKVAIVGGGFTRKKAPYRDESWEIWAFSSKKDRYPRVTRWFEIHDLKDLKQQLAGRKPGRRSFKGYMRFMRRLDCPVYMMKVHSDIPNSVRFPVDDLLKEFGRCFTSTASFLIGLAILEGCDEIGLWGVSLSGKKKYKITRPAILYLLAMARQRGIKLTLTDDVSIELPENPEFPETDVIYAYDWQSPNAWWRKKLR